MRKSYTLKATTDSLANASKLVVSDLEALGTDHKTIYKVRLSLDEILTNIVSYAYLEVEVGDIDIDYDINEKERYIDITISDEGKSFNPLEEIKDPNLSSNIKEREIGGLGLFIVKNSMDEVKYLRKENKNILMMKKYF